MPDTKITALTAIGANPIIPSTFPIPMVDLTDTSMAASGTTKKVTVNQILGAGGTATLASATITGAATVGTTLGVTGVSTFAAGTALLPALTTTGDTNTGIYYPVADTFAVTTGGLERFRIDSSGNVGIWVTPSAWGSNYRAVEVSGAVNVFGATSDGNLAGIGANLYHNNTNYLYRYATFATMYLQDNGTHQWHIAPSGTAGNAITFDQAMTLNASGTLLVGLTTNTGTYSTPLVLSSNAGTVGWSNGPTAANPSNFYISGTGGNGVYLNGVAATSWTAVSDARFKDIIEPINDAVAKVGSLRSVIGKFKTDAEGVRRSFLIAQDVQSVLPEAVDASNPDKLGVAYTDVIPLLVAAIKELTARVQTLETR